jgi:muramoyltetrapeptide carboxypeptidase LdcA involved in peptidoglycan recycling
MIGHIENKFTMPIGIEADMDADRGTLTMRERAVA